MVHPLLFFTGCFLAVTIVSSFVMNAVRMRQPGAIARETFRLAVTIAFWIAIFAGVVWCLEWMLIRPLL